jgi:hypothetical protein
MALNALVLFKGTGSVDRALERQGFSVRSVDILKKFAPTDLCDIMEWDYKQFEPGHFQYIHASPVCTEFSQCLTARPRNFPAGDRLVQRALEIIDYLKPTWWSLENPQTGHLKRRPYMLDLPFQDVCYCKYGLPYRKATRLWGNLLFLARPMCLKGYRCEQYDSDTRSHPCKAQAKRSRAVNVTPEMVKVTKEMLYAMPAQLCDDMALAAKVDPSSV